MAYMHHKETQIASKHPDPAISMPFLLLFIVVATFFIWCCCVGAWLARLWYYDGQLHRKFLKYDIQPQYIRERLVREEEKKPRQSQKVVDVPRWHRDVTTLSFERVQEFDSSSLRHRIFESKRISRLPAFEQDDGGDGSGFPDMPVDMTADEYNEQHFPRRYNFRDLGLSGLAQDDWLTYYHDEQITARDHLLEVRREDCIQMRPGREAEDACGELWQEVAKFLSTKYPMRFWEQKENAERKLYDDDTRESYPLGGPFGWLTLDTMARLVREDFCIFSKSPFSAQFTLLAGTTCFPSGWRLRARVGHSIESQQETILPWEKLPEILTYIDELRNRPLYKRHVAFIQTVRPSESDYTKKYFIQESKDFFSGDISFLQAESLHARIEQQMFRKLPKSGAVVLTTRVQIEPLVRMEERKLRHLAKEIRSWPAHIARLKGRDLWGRAVLGFIEQFPMAHDDASVMDAGEMTEPGDDIDRTSFTEIP
ncbi:uncharacterized protein N0V89_000859 [Didymosphaeria variabile]|uniref:Uncharacterized protein n=1 Tax=Didymosphaeria variabile TaxID=1932322 RepID=A0A9W8XVG6_9PLEO|nr:uncharacterized protein N0V89_000859 [Didymosphaeria variabile]KAJ4360298.1 hypothetical protein N0V89_000859 [Didymosphaeria variabile]